MSSAEFTDWIAYSQIEHFGFAMDNWRNGVNTAAIVNAVHATIPVAKGKRRPKALQASDYYPESKKREPDLTPAQKQHIRKKHAKRKSSK